MRTLSATQQRLWVLHNLAPHSPAHNVFRAVRITGELNADALREALRLSLVRHPSLCTVFVARDGIPALELEEETSVQLEEIDVRSHPASAREQKALAILESDIRLPFDLEAGPLLRATLIRQETHTHVLLITGHAIVIDEPSMGRLLREISGLYDLVLAGQAPIARPVPDAPANAAPTGPAIELQVAYWKRQLDGRLPLIELPADRPRPASRSFRGGRHRFRVDALQRQALEQLGREHGAGLPAVLLAAYKALIHRYTGQEDLVVGAVIRDPAEPRPMGSRDDTAVLRTDLAGDPTFCELLLRTARVVAEAETHRDVPIEEILEIVPTERSLSHTPLFQVAFHIGAAASPAAFGGCAVRPIDLHNATAHFDLSLSAADAGDSVELALEYNADLFEAETVARLAGHLETLIAGALAQPEQPISRLPLLGAGERERVLRAWNDTASPYPRKLGAHQLFEAQVARTGDAVAVIAGAQQLTYAELNRRANQLAHRLRALGVGPEARVGLCVERSAEMAIALLGVLKAGGAYVPLEPSYPLDRLAFMMEDAGIGVLLTQERLAGPLGGRARETICLDRDWAAIAGEPASNPEPLAGPDNLAYVIYTSGSTGKPKGVMIPHRGLTNYLWWSIQAYGVADGTGAPVHSPLTFDLTVTSLFTPLLTGRTVAFVSEDAGVEGLAEAVRRGRDWSLVKITPAHLEALAHTLSPSEAEGRVNALIIGGEALWHENLAFWRTHAPRTRLINEYGPTETVVGCCVYEVAPGAPPAGAVPIGLPIANTQMHVLDRHLEPVPIGVTGELYIGGHGVGRGYLNRPELTAERFVPDPFSSEPGARLYRTGDLGLRRADGVLEYLGRADHQVKLRGFRIELGEIEAVVREHPRTREVLTLLREDRPGDKQLVSYIVPTERSAASDAALAREVKAALAAVLPSYMVPSAFVLLDALPLTGNGKVDRAALPPPAAARPRETETVVPTSPLESQLVEIWEELIAARPIGITDDFFALGGNSLLAVHMVRRIEEVTGKKLPLATLFQDATIEGLARALLEANAADSSSPLVHVQSGGSKRPFFFFHGDYNGGGFYCRTLAAQLGAEQPFYALHPHGLYTPQVPPSIEAMAADYMDVLRENQPHGPYLLGGHCNGAYVAFELARLLVAEGEQVDLLVLVAASAANIRFRWLSRLIEGLGAGFRANLTRRHDWFVSLRTSLVSGEAFLRDWAERLTRFARAGLRDNMETVQRKARSGLLWIQAVRSGGRADDAAPARTPDGQRRAVRDAYTRAIAGYVPRPYRGEITVFLAEDDPAEVPTDATWGWSKVSRAVEVHTVPGDHLTCLTKHIDALGRQLRACLQRVAPG